MNLNNNYSANNGSYLRPRVVYSKGPCPLSGPAVPSLNNMMMGLGFQDNLGRLERLEKYSRKVFIGGLPPDINESEFDSWCLVYYYICFGRFKLTAFTSICSIL